MMSTLVLTKLLSFSIPCKLSQSALAALSSYFPKCILSVKSNNQAELTLYICSKMVILEAVQINRYKNGLFVTSITPRTDLVNDMTIMINSAQVTGLDNMRLQNVRAGVEQIKRRVAAGDKIGKTVAGKKLTIYDFYGQHVSELLVSTPGKLFHCLFGSGCYFRRVRDYLAFCIDMLDCADLRGFRMSSRAVINTNMHAG